MSEDKHIQEKNKQALLLKEIPQRLLPWYEKHKRELPWRKDCDPYHVWLSEIMLQQTRVEAVKEYYRRFLEALPTLEALANVDEDRLLKLWEGLGYYNRARNLKKAAIQVMEKQNGNFPNSYEDIIALPGIGEYTAGAIASICYGLPIPAVDGNVLRVITRITEDDTCIDSSKMKRDMKEQLAVVYPAGECGHFTQSLMELGATVCIPNGQPHCEECPLQEICRAHSNGSYSQYPVREKKKERRKEEKTVFVLSCGKYLAVEQRPSKGLLANLWQLPNVPGELTAQQASRQVTQWQGKPDRMDRMLRYTHIFSHVEWHMTAYYIPCLTMSDSFEWVTREQLESEVAIPSAFRPFVDDYLKNSEEN